MFEVKTKLEDLLDHSLIITVSKELTKRDEGNELPGSVTLFVTDKAIFPLVQEKMLNINQLNFPRDEKLIINVALYNFKNFGKTSIRNCENQMLDPSLKDLHDHFNWQVQTPQMNLVECSSIFSNKVRDM